MPKFEYRHEDSAAASAPNWRRVLLVDACVGVVVIVLGVVALVAWDGIAGTIIGWLLVLLGVAYVLAIVGRYRTWKARRRDAGIDA
jgi:hypothetical protein